MDRNTKFLCKSPPKSHIFAVISNWGALNKRAEIILIEPATGNADEGIVEKT